MYLCPNSQGNLIGSEGLEKFQRQLVDFVSRDYECLNHWAGDAVLVRISQTRNQSFLILFNCRRSCDLNSSVNSLKFLALIQS